MVFPQSINYTRHRALLLKGYVDGLLYNELMLSGNQPCDQLMQRINYFILDDALCMDELEQTFVVHLVIGLKKGQARDTSI